MAGYNEIALQHIGPGLIAQIDSEVGRAIDRVRDHDADKISIGITVEVSWDKDGELACKASSKHAVAKNAVWYPPRPAQAEMDLKSDEEPTVDPDAPQLPAMAEWQGNPPETLALPAGEEVIEAEVVPEQDERHSTTCENCQEPLQPNALRVHVHGMRGVGEGNAVFVNAQGSIVTESSYPLTQVQSEEFNPCGRGVLVTEAGVVCADCLSEAHARRSNPVAA